MRRIRQWMVAAAVCLMAGVVADARGQDAGETDPPLLQFLQMVPSDLPVTELGGYVAFVDVRSMTTDFFSAFPPETYPPSQAPDMMRVYVVINWTTHYASVRPALQETLGFPWSEVDWIGEAGQPPERVSAFGVTGNVVLESVGRALADRGYDTAVRDGVYVWHRYDDREIRPAEREPEDPFGGMLGQSARVVMLGDAIVGTPTWPLVESATGVAVGDVPSLADMSAYRAVADVLSRSEGQPGPLLQAMIWADSVPRSQAAAAVLGANGTPERIAEVQAQLEQSPGMAGRLPAYKLMGVGDRQDGAAGIVDIVLIYDSIADARRAAEVLPQRLRGYTSLASSRPILRILGATVTSHVVSAQGHHATVVRLRQTPVRPAEEPFDLGLLFRRFISLHYSRDTAFLAVSE